MRRLPVAAVFALGLAILACAPGGREEVPAEEFTRLLITGRTKIALLSTEQPLITVQIDGAEDAVFLVDTGAEYSWLDQDYAVRNGFEREPLGAALVDINDAEGGITERTPVARLLIGSALVTSWKAPILRSLWDGVDGSLGQDFLRLMLVVFDGPGGHLILDKKDVWPSAQPELFLGGTAYSYDLNWSDGVPKVDLPVADTGRIETFWFDTGVERMLLVPDLIEQLGYKSIGTTKSTGLAGSSHDVALVDVPRLTLDDVWFQGEAQEGTHCALGWGVLREAVVIFDNATDRMLLVLGAVWRDG